MRRIGDFLATCMGLGIVLAVLAIQLAIPIGIIWIIVHFACKYW